MSLDSTQLENHFLYTTDHLAPPLKKIIYKKFKKFLKKYYGYRKKGMTFTKMTLIKCPLIVILIKNFRDCI